MIRAGTTLIADARCHSWPHNLCILIRRRLLQAGGETTMTASVTDANGSR
ncbi:hypothetical protein ACVPSA_18080 [Salmonella enterica subsp. enterica serovar Enteritidis]